MARTATDIPHRAIPAPVVHERGKEYYASLIAAGAILLALLLFSRMVYVIDLRGFQQQVSRLFHAEVKPPEMPPTRFTDESLAAEQRHILSKARDSLFHNPLADEEDRPRAEPTTQPALPAAPRLPEENRLPEAGIHALEEAEASLAETLGPDLPVVSRRAGPGATPLSGPNLGTLYASGREGGGGPGRPGELRPEFKVETPPPRPRIEGGKPQAAPAIQRATAPQLAPLPVGALTHEKPPSPVPSLDKDVNAVFTVYQEPGAKECFFRLEIRLKPESAIPASPKDLLFLIDVSQSIRGPELETVRKAVVDSLAKQNPEDRWSLAVFSESTAFYASDFRPAAAFAAERDAVEAFIDRRESERETNVFEATRKILEALPRSPRPVNVFLLSDGKATYGTADVHRIVHDFQRIKRDTFSIFTFNAGPGGNRYLLQLLAYRSRGEHLDAPEVETAGSALKDYIARFRDPVLTQVVMSHTNLSTDEVYPGVLSNLYRDSPVVIYGRSETGKTVVMRVAGYHNGRPREFYFRTVVPRGTAQNPQVARQWAQGKAHAKMAALADDPDNRELRQSIIDLAEKYSLETTLELVRPRNIFRRIFGLDR